jgi:hypothetical protein
MGTAAKEEREREEVERERERERPTREDIRESITLRLLTLLTRDKDKGGHKGGCRDRERKWTTIDDNR